jgi:hypothetical protein
MKQLNFIYESGSIKRVNEAVYARSRSLNFLEWRWRYRLHNCAPTKTRNQPIMWVKGVKPLGVMAELHYYSLGDLVYLLKNGKCGLVSLCTVC